MAKKIAAAADHGTDAFIFDWNYYDDGPFLERPIDRGFLKAKNNHRLKFGLMWVNHDWIDIHPYKRGTPQRVLYPGKVTPATFDKICDHVIKPYFRHPSYWRIDGQPYFSFYDFTALLDSFGFFWNVLVWDEFWVACGGSQSRLYPGFGVRAGDEYWRAD